MQDLEGAISEANERLSKLEKLWPSKESRSLFTPDKILCFVDANEHSSDAIRISLQLSKEFDTTFSIRSIFDKELLKLADTDLAHLKQSMIEIVKDNLRDTGLNKGITFLEGDAIESIQRQLATEYDILVLPVPYHSNLSDHPEAVAMGSLGEYLVSNIDKPLFLIPEINERKEDLFSSIIIVVSDVSDIIQNQNYIRAVSRNRSHLTFVFLYDAKDIEALAESSKGIVDAEMVKKRVHAKMEQYGKHTVDQFGDHIENVEFTIFNGEFSENIHNLIKEKDASLMLMILPENRKGYRFLLFQDMLRDKKLNLPVMVLRVSKEEKKEEKAVEKFTEIAASEPFAEEKEEEEREEREEALQEQEAELEQDDDPSQGEEEHTTEE